MVFSEVREVEDYFVRAGFPKLDVLVCYKSAYDRGVELWGHKYDRVDILNEVSVIKHRL